MSVKVSHKDFPVGAVALTTWDGTEYRVTNETVAVLFDNEGNVCDLANNAGTAMSHVRDGQGVALALKGDGFGGSVDDVQAQFDTAREHYVDCFGI